MLGALFESPAICAFIILPITDCVNNQIGGRTQKLSGIFVVIVPKSKRAPDFSW